MNVPFKKRSNKLEDEENNLKTLKV